MAGITSILFNTVDCRVVYSYIPQHHIKCFEKVDTKIDCMRIDRAGATLWEWHQIANIRLLCQGKRWELEVGVIAVFTSYEGSTVLTQISCCTYEYR